MPRGAAFGLVMTTGGAIDARNIGRALREAGRGDLQRDLGKGIRAVGEKNVLPALRSAALNLPDVSAARRGDGRSARQAIAGSVQVTVRANGVRIIANRKKMPAGSEALPAAFEKGKFRHPIFPRSDQSRGEWRWVQQTSRAWFRPTVMKHQADFSTAVRAVIEDTINKLERN